MDLKRLNPVDHLNICGKVYALLLKAEINTSGE